MIERTTFNQIRSGVCAIGYTKVKPGEHFADMKPGDRAKPPPTEILGTGFLVRGTTVLTNRHVVDALRKSRVSRDDWCMLFVYPREGGGWHMSGRKYQRGSYFADPRFDVALIEFGRDTSKDFQQCRPLPLGELSKIVVGQQIAVCGYLHGNALLELGNFDVSRFGPVLQQGFVSAVAPFDVEDPRQITAVLTDVRTGPGMSGSPVFIPENGQVIGLHFAGETEGRAGLALPVDEQKIAGWLQVHDQLATQKKVLITGSAGGDITSVEQL